MKPETPYPTINIRDTNLVSLPLAGQTAQLEFLGPTDLSFRILDFDIIHKPALLFISMTFSKSHLLLGNPPAGYVPTWSLKEEGGKVVVYKRRVERHGGKLMEKVDVELDGSKTHILTIHCPGSVKQRILGITKPYFNPSLHLSVARGGHGTREKYDTI